MVYPPKSVSITTVGDGHTVCVVGNGFSVKACQLVGTGGVAVILFYHKQ